LTQVDEKIRYAKWKAADIAKAFREGRTPTPGPANQEVQDSPAPDITIEAASPEQSTPAGFTGSWPASPSRFDSGPTSPGNWSTIATPGTADHRAFDLPSSPVTGGPGRVTVSDELEGLPEEFPSPEQSLFGEPHIRRPEQSSHEQPVPPQLPTQPSEMIVPSEVAPTHTETHPVSIDTPVNPTPQPPTQSYQQVFQPTPPPPIPIQQQPSQTIRNVVPPPPPPTVPVPPPPLTPKQIAQAQKHCRYAISALDYEDFERAREDLFAALRIIGG
jgi:vacuolar protein sorting-associated protein VTA1